MICGFRLPAKSPGKSPERKCSTGKAGSSYGNDHALKHTVGVTDHPHGLRSTNFGSSRHRQLAHPQGPAVLPIVMRRSRHRPGGAATAASPARARTERRDLVGACRSRSRRRTAVAPTRLRRADSASPCARPSPLPPRRNARLRCVPQPDLPRHVFARSFTLCKVARSRRSRAIQSRRR